MANLKRVTGLVTEPIATAYHKIPAVTTTERNALTAAAGMILFNTTLTSLEQYTGTGWIPVSQGLPSITTVEHNTTGTAYAAVGETIKLTGANFGSSGAGVKINSTACTTVSHTVVNEEITCVIPSVSNATYDVEVTTSGGLTVTKTNGITISANPSWASNTGDTTMEYTQGTTVTNGAGTEGTTSYQAELFLGTSSTTTITQSLSGATVESGGALFGKIEMVAHGTPALGYYLKTVSGQTLPAVTTNTAYTFNIVATEVTEGQTASQSVTLTVLANFYGFGGDN
jgi:hypothetical protein